MVIVYYLYFIFFKKMTDTLCLFQEMFLLLWRLLFWYDNIRPNYIDNILLKCI